MSTERAAGRRATDRERTHLRRLEVIVRNFIAHFEDHPAERFAPRTRQMVEEAREVCASLDAQRAEARRE